MKIFVVARPDFRGGNELTVATRKTFQTNLFTHFFYTFHSFDHEHFCFQKKHCLGASIDWISIRFDVISEFCVDEVTCLS